MPDTTDTTERPYVESDDDAIAACAADAARIDPTLKPCPLDEWRAFVRQSFNHGGRDFVVAEVDDRIVGLLFSTRYPEGERILRNVRVIVHPEFRRRGIGTRLADRAESQDPAHDTTLQSRCLGSWTVGQAMLESRGFRAMRVELTMVCAPAVEPPLAVDGIAVRGVRPGDDADWARMVDEGYADGPGYAPLEPEDIAIYRSEPGFRLWFAEDAGRVVGKCHVRPFAGEIWINSLVVSPSHRGRRIGRMLMVHALNALAADGVLAVRLGVRVENAPAVAIYQSLGFETEETETVWWKTGGVRPAARRRSRSGVPGTR